MHVIEVKPFINLNVLKKFEFKCCPVTSLDAIL